MVGLTNQLYTLIEEGYPNQLICLEEVVLAPCISCQNLALLKSYLHVHPHF